MNSESKLQTDSSSEQAFPPSRALRTRRWVLFAGLAAVVLIGWLIYPKATGAPSPAAASAPAQVFVSKPLKHDLDTRLGFLGQFSAVDQVELRAQVGGTLTSINFKDGDIVRKSDLLFTIDSRPYEITLDQANANLESSKAKQLLAEHEQHRAQVLLNSNAGTQQNLDQRNAELQTAQASLNSAGAQVRDARFDLDHCRITAPFSGRIGAHLASTGSLIAGSRSASSPTTLLATLVSLNPVHLDFDMSEADFQTFTRFRQQNGQLPDNKIAFAAGSDQQFSRTGVLDFVNNQLDRSSGTIHARATVQNTDLSLTPGGFARIRLAVARPASTLLVPDAAVLADQSRHIVMTVSSDNTVLAKQVEVGDMRGGLRVIRSGISEQDRVIIGGLPYAAPGAKVTPQDSEIHFAAIQD